MKRNIYVPATLLGLLLLGVFVAGAMSAAPSPAETRKMSQKLMNDGNWKDAYEGFHKLCLDQDNDPQQVGDDLARAIQCLNNLGRTKEIDGLLAGTITAHKDNWRLLLAAAQQYVGIDHQGFLIAGAFERGQHRGGGKVVNAVERDRVRALQLLQQAIPLTQKDDRKPEVAQFFLNLSEILLSNRGVHEAWRLQTLTPLDQLPDYDEGSFGFREYIGAPVNAAGEPIFYTTPKSWEAADSDGQRWRWAQEQAIENAPDLRTQVWLQFARFLHQQYGVQSMQIGAHGRGFFRGPQSDDDTKKDESGTYALHTLDENETIAKLASGIKRFKLPDEFNFIKIFQKIVAAGKSSQGEQAFTELAQIFENRRQYDKAADYWQKNIDQYGAGPNDWKQERRKQIVSNWGAFEAVSTQPAHQGATVDFRFRNGKKVKFDARAIKIAELLADTKAYLKSDPANRIDWNKINIGNIGYRLVQQNEQKYLGEAIAAWELDLDPRPNHFDRRITVTTPLQKAGAYLVTATMADGNVSKIILWVADTALVHKQLDGKNLYYAADAVSGKPIGELNLEFFGWQQRHLGGNRFQVITTNFAESTSPDGLVTPDPRDLKTDFQWLVIARGKTDRLAFLGFQGVWDGKYYDAEYNAIKVFTITDRPVYRPAQKVNFKIWVRRAQYDMKDVSQFAKQSFPVEIFNPKGDKIFSETLATDEYGGLSGAYTLPADATLGQYRIHVQKQEKSIQVSGGNTFRVEEYKKPEFEVTIDAPSEPVMLGEKITAKIKAKYYFGSPVVKATVKYKILRSNYSDTWYPVAPWDWCYEPGYWWFSYDYSWYPGWDKWAGCVRPTPIWWPHRRSDPPEVVAEVEREIGPDGTIDVEIDTAIAKELHGDSDHEYTITAEVRDESRRTIVGQGKVLVARKPFKVFTWVDRGYYRIGDVIQANFQAQTLDRKPVTGEGVLKLFIISYENGKPVETPMQEWKLATDAEGRATQQLDASAAGQYRLSFVLTDKQGHAIEGGYIFTIVGAGADAAEFRFNALELVPDKKEYAPGDTVKLQINTDRADSTVLLFVRPTNGIYLPPKVLRMRGKTTVEEIAIVQKDMPNFFVEAVTIADGKVYSETKEIVVPPEKRILNVAVVPSAETYKPGQKAKVKVHLTDASGENYVGSTVLTMYDKAVEYISGGSNVPEIKEFFWKWRRHHNPRQQTNLGQYSYNMTLPNKPGMSYLGVFGATVATDAEEAEAGDRSGAVASNFGMARGGGVMRKGAQRGFNAAEGLMLKDAAVAPMPGAPMIDPAASGLDLQSDKQASKRQAEGEFASQLGTPLVEPSIRSKFADTALWVASLTTDKTGMAEVELDMPENLTGWKIRVWGMGHGTRVGSGEADVVTRKDLIIRLQVPRFFVQKDEVVLSANVHNYLPKEKEVTVTLDVPGDVLKPLVDTTVRITIPAGGEQRVDWRCTVLNEGEATVRMKALTDEESDAMEMKLPSYIHGMLNPEAWAGTVSRD
jgi:hypothetical protein